MILLICEIISEWICVIICSHVLSEKRNARKHNVAIFFFIYTVVAFIAQYYGGWTKKLKLLAYIAIFFYLRSLNYTWGDTIGKYGQLILIIPLGQLTGYYLLKKVTSISDEIMLGVCSNCLLCACLILMKLRSTWIYKSISRHKGIVISGCSVILLFSVLQLYNSNELLQGDVVNIFLISAVCIVVLIAMWAHVEREKEVKERELGIHKLYFRSFDNIIASVRRRQHEFDNQLAALQGMQHTMQDSKKLMNAQRKYIEGIKAERVPACLLSTNIDPVIAGFLYTKFLEAREKNIDIAFEVAGKTVEHIPLYEQIELFGILVDNAIEALQSSGKTKMEVAVLYHKDHTEYRVMNQSERIENSELERFFKDGYSSKGDNRGMGLSRLKEIAGRWNLQIMTGNRIKNDENFIEIKIIYADKKRG